MVTTLVSYPTMKEPRITYNAQIDESAKGKVILSGFISYY